ncbi:hypothetical protein Dsin_000970 [Dipteronia sinensis]|uniref:Uncharacterized protein n=1 Tax=Dipteronia sinensis TaxID=43782 RepID=A0AAE0EIA5_9ROSI|nr:hypothetical protein Dsin_000970 [Dipteronia sinensis]
MTRIAKMSYDPIDIYDGHMRRSRSASTNDEAPPRRCRETTAAPKYNIRYTQDLGKKSNSVLSSLRQRKEEKLKDYLTRFSQDVSEVHDPNDNVAVSAFINSLQHNQLSLSLRQREPTTYASLVDDVEGYTMAEEEKLSHERELIHGS